MIRAALQREKLGVGVVMDAAHTSTARCMPWLVSQHEDPAKPLPPMSNYAQQNPAASLCVSVIAPTINPRHWSHESLYRSFAEQTHALKELLVLDEGPEPSPFFATIVANPQVSYTHICTRPEQRQQTLERLREASVRAETPESRRAWGALIGELEGSGALSIGVKRNWLVAQARGPLIAHFDDDDVYLPSYLSRMAAVLMGSGAGLVKLASWLHFDANRDALAYFDGNRVRAVSTYGGASQRTFWGYGFSYVYLRFLALEVPFEPLNNDEDNTFILAAARRTTVLAYADMPGDATVCHVAHRANSSRVVDAAGMSDHMSGEGADSGAAHPLTEGTASADAAAFDAFFGGAGCRVLLGAALRRCGRQTDGRR